MSFDAHANFAVSAVATAPLPATSGTSLTEVTGQGSLFPAVPFNATVWPAGSAAISTNSEIVRVTNVAGDVLTITRTQEGTGARAIQVGDLIANTMTVKVWTDVEAPRLIPAAHADIDSQTTTSGTLVDITGSSITVTNTVACGILAWLALQIDLASGANTDVAVAVSIDGIDSNETTVSISSHGSFLSTTKIEASGVSSLTPIAPGTHTIKGRWRRSSGSGTAEIVQGEISGMALQIL